MKFNKIGTECILSLKDRAHWEEALKRISSPCMNIEYCNSLVFSGKNDIFLLINHEIDFYLTFTTRSFQNSLDIYSPYGLGGLYCQNLEDGFIFYNEWAKQNRIITSYLTLDPRIPPPGPTIESLYKNKTLYFLDLTDTYSALSGRYSKSIKAKINNKKPITITHASNLPSDAFIELYYSTMKRVQAHGTYFFSTQTLRNLLQSPSTFAIGALNENNDLLCASLFITKGSSADYFINCSNEEGRDLTAALLNTAIKCLKNKGISNLNLGGGARDDDGLAKFKSRFGATPKPFYVYKKIHDIEAYDDLCSKATTLNKSYFPPYYDQ